MLITVVRAKAFTELQITHDSMRLKALQKLLGSSHTAATCCDRLQRKNVNRCLLFKPWTGCLMQNSDLVEADLALQFLKLWLRGLEFTRA
jgi:hypothetical protein